MSISSECTTFSWIPNWIIDLIIFLDCMYSCLIHFTWWSPWSQIVCLSYLHNVLPFIWWYWYVYSSDCAWSWLYACVLMVLIISCPGCLSFFQSPTQWCSTDYVKTCESQDVCIFSLFLFEIWFVIWQSDVVFAVCMFFLFFATLNWSCCADTSFGVNGSNPSHNSLF